MNRQSRKFWSLVLIASMLASGCAPQQPFYCREDGDLSHYLGVATEIEYPDVEESPIVRSGEHAAAADAQEHRQLRDLGSVAHRGRANHAVPQPGDAAARRAGRFDGAGNDLAHARQPGGGDDDVRSGPGRNDDRPLGRRRRSTATGTEAALSEFDAQLDASVFWEKNREPQNRATASVNLFPQILAQDLGTVTIGITKTTADGTTVRDSATTRTTRRTTFRRSSRARRTRARFLPASGKRTSKRRSAIRCCKAAARNTTASPVR